MDFFSDARAYFRLVGHQNRYYRKCATMCQPRITHATLGLSMGDLAPYFFQLYIDTSLWKIANEMIIPDMWREMGLQRIEINCLWLGWSWLLRILQILFSPQVIWSIKLPGFAKIMRLQLRFSPVLSNKARVFSWKLEITLSIPIVTRCYLLRVTQCTMKYTHSVCVPKQWEGLILKVRFYKN